MPYQVLPPDCVRVILRSPMYSLNEKELELIIKLDGKEAFGGRQAEEKLKAKISKVLSHFQYTEAECRLSSFQFGNQDENTGVVKSWGEDDATRTKFGFNGTSFV